jgi:HCOMODA/2-hydroxy-3-carboxy-muconic semialdehyde decarboxylase
MMTRRNQARQWGHDDSEGNGIEGLKRDLVAANHILFRHNIVDAFGHVSVRHPDDAARFLMARRVPPGLVEEDDVLEFGLDGELVADDGSPVFLERYIHSALYAARADIQAVVHSHSPNIIAFGVVGGHALRAVCHTCGFLGLKTPIFEMRDVEGDATDLMITSQAKGRALAAALRDANVILMRGHGSTAVGSNVAEAVYRAIYTETNARIQATAATLGPVTFLSEKEAESADALTPQQVERSWQLWRDQVRR